MKALILGLSTLGAAVDISKRIARQPLQIAAPKCPVANWPSDTFSSSTAGSSRVSISLATKGFLFASRQNRWRQTWDTADIGRKTQVASDGLTKSALISPKHSGWKWRCYASDTVVGAAGCRRLTFR